MEAGRLGFRNQTLILKYDQKRGAESGYYRGLPNLMLETRQEAVEYPPFQLDESVFLVLRHLEVKIVGQYQL